MTLFAFAYSIALSHNYEKLGKIGASVAWGIRIQPTFALVLVVGYKLYKLSWDIYNHGI